MMPFTEACCELLRAVCSAGGPLAPCPYDERLLQRPQEEDRPSPPRRGTTKSEAARSFSVSRSSVKRYAKLAEEGRPLAPKRRPGSSPKMDQSPRRLLE